MQGYEAQIDQLTFFETMFHPPPHFKWDVLKIEGTKSGGLCSLKISNKCISPFKRVTVSNYSVKLRERKTI